MRRKPWVDRVKDYLNPGDFLLWLSEEFETRDWDSTQFGTPLALGLHITLLVARASSGDSGSSRGDDVFGDVSLGSGWLSYIVRTITIRRTTFAKNFRLLLLSTCLLTFLFSTPYIRSIGKDIIGYSRAPSMLPKAPLQPTEFESILLQYPHLHYDFLRAYLGTQVPNQGAILTPLETCGSLQSGIQYPFAYDFSASLVLAMS